VVDLVVAALGGADCERIRSGWLAQPANATSSLLFVALGVWLLGRGRVVPGVAMAAVGVSSFAYHGPQPGWAHLAHNASIVVLSVVVLASAVPALIELWRVATVWTAVALGVYWAGRTGSQFCSPDGLWQFHAAWHALSAVGLGLLLTRTGPAPSASSSR
jgi:hypothetical protein